MTCTAAEELQRVLPRLLSGTRCSIDVPLLAKRLEQRRRTSERGRCSSGPVTRTGVSDADQLRSARGCSDVSAVLVEVAAAGAVLDVSATGATVVVVLDVVVLVVSAVTGALIVVVGFGSALRLPSRFSGAPGGVP